MITEYWLDFLRLDLSKLHLQVIVKIHHVTLLVLDLFPIKIVLFDETLRIQVYY